MREFLILKEYLTDVPDNHVKYRYDTTKELTHEQLVDILVNGNIQYRSFGTKDHPEFAKLRNQLEELGYIRTSRISCNGDIVLKSFKLNDMIFRKNTTFYCASALNNMIKVRNKQKA
jgi:hypothetical protein